NDRLEHRFDLGYRMANVIGTSPPPAKRHPLEYLRGGQIYINTETEDTLLPQVIQLIGDDHIILGSDMPHGDREPFAKRDFVARTDLSDASKQKILWDNGWQFYGLPVPPAGTAAKV